MSNEPVSLVVFTDGASRGNPGPGGWGAVIIEIPDDQFQIPKNEEVEGGRVVELGGREERTTNNRMELTAALQALNFAARERPGASVRLYTDSSYVLNGITRWIHGWKQRGWQTKEQEAVKNSDLWQALDAATAEVSSVDWRLLSGHSGLAGNERADRIATSFADREPVELYQGPLPEYPLAGQNLLSPPAATGGRGSQSGRAYSYVSLVDGEVKTHQSWPECQARVKGKDAWFRKALSSEHEAEIIDNFRQGQREV